MPYIATTTNVKLSENARNALKERMGEAIGLIPGKSEGWLMLSWRDGVPMAFQGKAAPCAVCEVKLFGAAPSECYDRLTGALCEMLEQEAGVPQNRVYVTYQEVEHWGFNGSNF